MAAKQKGKGPQIIISLVLLIGSVGFIIWHLAGPEPTPYYLAIKTEVGHRLGQTLASSLQSGDPVVIAVNAQPSLYAEGATTALTEAGFSVDHVFEVDSSDVQESELSPREYVRKLTAAYRDEAGTSAAILIFSYLPTDLDVSEIGAKVVAIGDLTAERRRQLETGELVALLIENPQRTVAPDGESIAEAFERKYVIVTSENVGQY